MFNVYLSSDGGQSWRLADRLNKFQVLTEEDAWQKKVLEIKKYVQLTDKFRIKFEFVGHKGQGYMPAAISEGLADDIEILTANDVKLTSVEDEAFYGGGKTYPNPFGDYAVIEFAVEKPGEAFLEITDALGNKIKRIEKRCFSETGRIIWDRTNDAGETVAPGVYFYKIVLGAKTIGGKIIAK